MEQQEINYPLELNQTNQRLLNAQMQVLQLQMEKLIADEKRLTEK